MKTTTLPLRNSPNRSLLRLGFLLNALALAIAWLAPSQLAKAQCPQICDSSSENTAFGINALPGDSGSFNTAIGFQALQDNTFGSYNTATGDLALENNTTGFNNTASGRAALENNTTGSNNTAIGAAGLFSNTTGANNTVTGTGALQNNTTGSINTAIGAAALSRNTTGFKNTATGSQALLNNTVGNSNTAMGFDALFNSSGSGNVALGVSAGADLTTGSNNIVIGNRGVIGESGKIRIGTASIQTATFIAGIRDTPLANGAAVAVGVTADGQLGVRASSTRFKEAIKPMDRASEAVLALKPVTFRYKHELDPEGIPQFGLVAEDVEKVNPDLVARDQEGKPYTVRYEAVNVMLLNEFLKEHRKNEEQGATIAEQQKDIDALTAELKEQRSLIRKVSAQLELTKAAPQTALNSQ